jgi:hypothetical protein
VKKNLDQNFIENNREELERRHLTHELSSLKDHRHLLQQKLNLIQEHHKQLQLNVEREHKRKAEMHEKYDEQIRVLRSSIREYVSEKCTRTDEMYVNDVGEFVARWHVDSITFVNRRGEQISAIVRRQRSSCWSTAIASITSTSRYTSDTVNTECIVNVDRFILSTCSTNPSEFG